MTFIAYEPEPPMFESAFTALQRIVAPSIGCRISVDPLGPVNKIVSLVAGDGSRQRRIKSVLWHVPAGAQIEVKRGWVYFPPPKRARPVAYGGFRLTAGGSAVDGYRVTVDGRTVLTATDSEIWPPAPAEPVPWRVRTRRAGKSWLRTRARAAGDRIAARFGYVHGDEAGW